MTTRVSLAFLAAILASIAAAQESPTPTSPASPEKSPSLSISPEGSTTPQPAFEQTSSVSPARSVRISFIPPPSEGTISLGIYDKNGKLVRVLHQEAKLNEFAIGADALVTQWDGKNDDEEDLPAGKYRARGYLVGSLKIEDLGQSSGLAIENDASRNVKVRLVPNPLRNDKRSIVDIGVGFDSDGSYLKTNDDLPLVTVSEMPNLIRAGITKKSENAVDIWQDDGTTVRQFRISNLDQMMAFDCGEFELK
ncbi:MAG: hypothetical protein DMF28_06255 [Verrucomicrobia bacterium]|nr:MAG: hypothetical protein DMF28_06255 [Verrucomicrobiota bacterium]